MESSSKFYQIRKGILNRDSETMNHKAYFKPQKSKFIEGEVRRGRVS
jgi:hypothetical protein